MDFEDKAVRILIVIVMVLSILAGIGLAVCVYKLIFEHCK